MKKLLLFLTLIGMLYIPKSFAQLKAGDIAFIGFHTDADDGFTWISLTDIPANTEIYFGENGWNSSTNTWYVNDEGHIKYTAPATGLSCGTIVEIREIAPNTFSITAGTGTIAHSLGSFSLSSGGDQILAYRGGSGAKPASPVFLAGVHGDYIPASFDALTKWGTNNSSYINSGSHSMLPLGLTNGVNCISLYPGTPELDNNRYTGTLTGTSSALLAAINNASNWTAGSTSPIGISPINYPSPSVTCAVPCTEPDVASVTFSPATVCEGSTATLNIAGNLNDATQWHVYTGSCGGTLVGTTTGNSINVIPTSPSTTYFVRGEGGCTTTGPCGTVTITTTAADDASFNYGSTTFCTSDSDPSPTITGLAGGGFSSTAGLSINTSTGQIDVSASTPGTYSVIYTTAGACPNSSNVSVTINALDNPSFNYSAASYCATGADPTPTITGVVGGTFSSSAGLSINTSSGEVDLSASTPGSYIVTYTTSGTCANSSNVILTINAADDASFNYTAAAYCANDADPTPTITGLGGGTFSSTTGLSINTSTGEIDLSASTLGSYIVTYTTTGTCPNSSNVSITINAIDDASFSYSATNYINNDTDPTPTITGVSGGNFSSTAGLSINASTGEIDLSASTLGTYSVTYQTTGPCANSASASITIQSSVYTWTGAFNNDWTITVNWDRNAVPPANADIIIPSGLATYPTASSAVTFNSLTINSGATFKPQSTVTGPVTFKRNIPTTNWYLASTPIANETLENIIANNTFATGTGSNIGIGNYLNNGITPWLYANIASTGAYVPGLGVSVKLDAPGELSSTGNLNTSNIFFPVSATGSRNKFNLIGNPFTSFVNSETFATTNTSLLTEKTIWLWNGTEYKSYNAIDPIEIAPGQGFFVEASTNGTIAFSTANRSHHGTDTFMRQTPKTSFELFIENNDTKKSTKVFYLAGKTTDFDNGYDSKMFNGVASSFEVFTQLVSNNQGKKLAIQTLPDANYDSMEIPVGIKAAAGKEITFSLNASNFNDDLKIFLEDRLTNTFTPLNEANSTYKVTLSKNLDGIGRFYIHTTNSTLSIDGTATLENTSIYKLDNTTLRIAGLPQGNANIKLYSMLGKQVVKTAFTSNGTKDIALPLLAKGVYLVKLETEKGKLNKKIILE
ncbi:T9SS type A sorting domain-containing protein [Polaribacter sp. L3A8]|uniref:T9SS type A sorting domain-containing protein n=1 Tax=Polaribacter sp. L3A8 TaxID=2686361 RepID=UPI00131AE172|nr:T9SS type A sorting domain-containing protein [Polaribacter sp. L3A8]